MKEVKVDEKVLKIEIICFIEFKGFIVDWVKCLVFWI